MHIERILLRDIGPFADVTIEFPKGTDPKLADVYLLTGPNGTGKSTILYALAALIRGQLTFWGPGPELGQELLSTRMRSMDATVAARTDTFLTWAVSLQESQTLDPFGGTSLGPRLHDGILYYRSGRWSGQGESLPIAPFFQQRRDTPLGAEVTFSWAAFAYAGVRSVVDAAIVAVQEPKSHPLEDSLSFHATANTSLLANWIVSQNFRRLKAKDAGHQERAEQLAKSIREIEKAIADIIEDPDFGFVQGEEDDDVRVRWNGVVLRLGLLPDGLKSIISWVADLLMRLDRLPWLNGIPVLERSFLLLLDEIDIHLHPAWQRKVLPLVQRMFPNAQIIASTHSPFVVGSVDDAHIITLGLRGSSSVVTSVNTPQIGISYPAVVRSIFGIESEFDIDTENKLAEFHAARQRLLAGDAAARVDLDGLAAVLSERSEELRGIIALEMRQLQRQLRAAP